jgi:hypothetical protein
MNASKHKSIMLNSLLIKINFLKINSGHRQTKHTLSSANNTWEVLVFQVSFVG